MAGLIFHLIPHTHWDREWYLPAAAFQARFVAAMDDLIARLEADPAYRSFLVDGQTVLVEDYLRVRPERDGALKALVAAGRLQVGPWYVLADEQIPSGEALLRNLLLGAADAERLGGRLDVLYSPDAFGHPAIWPTLARECGIRYGVLWRGLGGEPGQERDWYRWRGPDGKEVLVWHLPPAGYELGVALPADAAGLPAAWSTVRRALVARASSQHIPVFIGADHHAAHPAIGPLRDLLAVLEPDSAFRVSRLDEFFQAAAETATPTPIAGELRWSYGFAWTLQGVHGTRAPLKRRYGAAELWLERYAEPLAALARRAGGQERRPLLALAWRTLARCQFHDTLAGSTSDAVARAAEARLTAVEALGREIVRGSVFDLVGHDPDRARERTAAAMTRPTLVLWNPAARARGGVVLADVTLFRRDVLVGPPDDRPTRSASAGGPVVLRGPDGRLLPLQVLDRRLAMERLDAGRHYPDLDLVEDVRVALRAPTVGGLGTLGLGLAAQVTAPPGPRPREERAGVRGRTLHNRWIAVTLEPRGVLSVHDRRTGERFGGLVALEDAGDAGDTYTYCPPAADRTRRATGGVALRRVAAGPLVAALETHVTLGREVAVRLVVMLFADSPVVRCVLELDNQATWHRLRARIPTGLRGTTAVAGTAFGAVARPPVAPPSASRYPRETPVATAPAHRFVAAALGQRGLALLAPGFFEYEWTAAGDVVVTLLRAVGELSRADLPLRRGHAGWPTATPLAQCIGPSRVELALAPISAAELARGDVLPAVWEDVFLPLRGFWLRDALAPDPSAPSPPMAAASGEIVLEGAGLVLSAVKPAEQGSPLVLRCYNATDRRTPGAWRLGVGAKSAHRVRADERASTALVLEARGKVVRFVAEPYELVTILVT